MAAVWDYLVGPNGTDARTIGWPLMDWRVSASIGAAYVLAIPLGNAIMRHREPFKLRRFSMLHNALLFSLSLYMCVECVRQSYRNFRWDRHFRLWCNPNDRGPGDAAGFSDSGRALANVLWVHYVSKAYEFVDTFIMVLKKNTRQISFLHVYHHATTFFPVWYSVVRFGPGGEAWFCCALNSAIHVFMYGYYFSASLGYRNTAVKKLVTTSQMLQFLSFISQSVWLLVIKDCYRPRLSPVMLLVQCVIFFVLFFNFYLKTYGRRPPQAGPKKTQ